MADNVVITPGTGETIAADEVGGAKYQRVKPVMGTDGVAVDIPGEATYGQDVDVTRLPLDPSWTVVGDSAANTAVTVTKAAGGSGVKHYVTGFSVVVRAAVVGASDARVELRDGATVKYDTYFGAAAVRGTRIEVQFSRPIEMTANTAVNVVVAALGASSIATVSLHGFSR